MPQKKPLNLSVPAELLDEFYAVCENYGHAKQKGQVLSAALLMFLRADPAEQGRCLEEIAGAEINAGVARMLERARKEQTLRVATRQAAERAPGEAAPQPEQGGAASPAETGQATGPGLPSEAPPGPQRRAAKRPGQSKHGYRAKPDAETDEGPASTD